MRPRHKAAEYVTTPVLLKLAAKSFNEAAA